MVAKFGGGGGYSIALAQIMQGEKPLAARRVTYRKVRRAIWPEAEIDELIVIANNRERVSGIKLGYCVEKFLCDRLRPTRLKRILAARGIQGVLLLPQRPAIAQETYDFVRAKSFPSRPFEMKKENQS